MLLLFALIALVLSLAANASDSPADLWFLLLALALTAIHCWRAVRSKREEPDSSSRGG